MSADDEIVAVIRNTTGRKIVRDLPSGTGNQAVMFYPDGEVPLTRREMESAPRTLPIGLVYDKVDPSNPKYRKK